MYRASTGSARDSRRVARWRPDRGQWVRSGTLLIAIGAAAASLGILLADQSWWFVAMGVAGVVLAASAVTRSLTAGRVMPVVAALAALIAVVTLFFSPAASILGIIPTPEAVAQLGGLGGSGIRSIISSSIPARPTAGIVFLIAAGVGVLAVIIDALANAIRLPAATGIPLVALAAVPSFIDGSVADPAAFLLTAAAYLLVLLASAEFAQLRAALGMGSIGIVLALVLSLVLPPVVNDSSGNGGSVYSTGINPIITLGDDLRRDVAITAMTYTTDSTKNQYFTLSTLEDFTGQSWGSGKIREQSERSLDTIGPVPGREPGIAVRTTTTAISIGNIRGRWLPVPYPPTSVGGLDGDWFWNPESLTIRTPSSSIYRQEYVVQSAIAEPTIAQLVAVGSTVAPGMERYLVVPHELPAIVAETAREVAGTAASTFDKAIALQRFFHNGSFAYSEEAPVDQGFDGSGAAVIGTFLEVRRGYCVHFASAMAAMARTLGIPARIATGFTTGDRTVDRESLAATFTVTTDNLHAWPELYFSGVGWVRFEPTPSRGSVPIFPQGVADDPTTLDIDESVPLAAQTASPVAPIEERPKIPEKGTAGTDVTEPTPTWVLPAAGGGVALAILLLLPLVIRQGRRARRRQRVARHGSTDAAWSEVRDAAIDLGVPIDSTATPREAEALIAVGFDASLNEEAAERAAERAAVSLRRLRMAVEKDAFAGPAAAENAVTNTVGSGAGATSADLATVLAGLRKGASPRRRLVALFAPASVLWWLHPRRGIMPAD